MRRRLWATVAGLLTALTAAACATTGASVAVLSATPSPPVPPGASTVSVAPSGAAGDSSCDPTASLKPAATLPAPGKMPTGTSLAAIAQRGRLIVGVDQNTYLFGFRNPQTGELEGFDIDIAKEMAKAIFGDPTKIEFKTLTSAQRIPTLQNGGVDLVVRTFSITCDRLKQIAFSSVYFQAQQRILAPTNSGIKGAADLGGKTVCATTGSTSLTKLLSLTPKPVVLAVSDWSDCLVALQQGQAAAVSTDDSILLGIKAQDPNLALVGDSLEPEPYGIGIKLGDTAMVRFVNGVLEQLRSNGRWKQIYQTWLGSADVSPPVAKYSDG